MAVEMKDDFIKLPEDHIKPYISPRLYKTPLCLVENSLTGRILPNSRVEYTYAVTYDMLKELSVKSSSSAVSSISQKSSSSVVSSASKRSSSSVVSASSKKTIDETGFLSLRVHVFSIDPKTEGKKKLSIKMREDPKTSIGDLMKEYPWCRDGVITATKGVWMNRPKEDTLLDELKNEKNEVKLFVDKTRLLRE